MANLSLLEQRVLRASLVAVWLATAACSAMEVHGASEVLLRDTGLPSAYHAPVILAGAAVDALVGLALWRWHRRSVYLLALANLFVMSIAATILLPFLWLDPLGRLTKTLPMVAVLFLLYRDAQRL